MPRNSSLTVIVNGQSLSIEDLAARPFRNDNKNDIPVPPDYNPFLGVEGNVQLAYGDSLAGQHAKLAPKAEVAILWEMTQPGGPLAKLPGESHRGWAAFLDFAMMGPSRTLKRLYRHYRALWLSSPDAGVPARSLKSLIKWSRENKWKARAAAFDEERHIAELAIWEAKRKALRAADWEDGAELRAYVKNFLAALPLFATSQEVEAETEEGDPVTVVTIALQATLPQIVQALKAASELQQHSLELPEDPSAGNLRGLSLDAAIEASLLELMMSGRYDQSKLSSRGLPVRREISEDEEDEDLESLAEEDEDVDE